MNEVVNGIIDFRHSFLVRGDAIKCHVGFHSLLLKECLQEHVIVFVHEIQNGSKH